MTPDLEVGGVLVTGETAQIDSSSERGVEVRRDDRWGSISGVNDKGTGTAPTDRH